MARNRCFFCKEPIHKDEYLHNGQKFCSVGCAHQLYSRSDWLTVQQTQESQKRGAPNSPLVGALGQLKLQLEQKPVLSVPCRDEIVA